MLRCTSFELIEANQLQDETENNSAFESKNIQIISWNSEEAFESEEKKYFYFRIRLKCLVSKQ